MSLEREQRRAHALQAAATVFAADADSAPTRDLHTIARHVLTVADLFDAWLTRPAPIASVQPIVGTPVPRDDLKGPPVSLVMPDDDMVTITLTGFDAEKVAVPSDFSDPNGMFVAPFTWVEDNTDLGELVVGADTLSANLRSHVGQTGTLTINITDVNGKPLSPVTVQIDPGALATVGAVFGTPVPRDDNPPA